jgi:hypothetical protein
VSEERKPKADLVVPLVPVGYQAQPLRKRMTRPLHSRRAAIFEAAEAAFKGKLHDEKQRGDTTPESSRALANSQAST